ncbi:hypothetical protein [Rhizobium sp. T136]|nr:MULTISPECIES: hypothetical protein [Rhizobium]MCS0463611.1 hypothetical protein [Rhizobium favelukesii]UFS84881.1 hypothetical protein LPB79_30715 [Rhizobium sp. T136]
MAKTLTKTIEVDGEITHQPLYQSLPKSILPVKQYLFTVARMPEAIRCA